MSQRVPHNLIAAVAALCLLLGNVSADAARNDLAESLPGEIAHLLDADPLPPVAVAPDGRHALLVHERQLLSRDRLAEPAVQLAGRRINPRTTAPHAPLEYYALTLIDLGTGTSTRLSLPRGALIGYPLWAPDGSRFAFTLTRASGTEIWVGDPAERRVRLLAHSVNAALGAPCVWNPDGRRLLCRRQVGAHPRVAPIELDALVQRGSQNATLGQPVVLNDELTRRLVESRLDLIDAQSGQTQRIGGPAAFESINPAPAGAFVLVTRLLEPYPTIQGVDSVRRVTEIWNRFGRIVARIPPGARAVDWQAGAPATLTWVERTAGVDRIMALEPPYSAEPTERFSLPHAFSGLRWIGDTTAAIVSDYEARRGRTELWFVDFGSADSAAHRVAGYSSTAPRSAIMGTNRFGKPALLAYDGGFYLRGEDRTAQGAVPFLDRVSWSDGRRTRVWEAQQGGYETLIDVLTPDASVLLTRTESTKAPPNYLVSASDGAKLLAVTSEEHPAPSLGDARRVPLEYARGDGVTLSASLYLPPGVDRADGLPLVLWAYPRNVAAGGTTELFAGRERFPTFERAFRLFFLLRGYAVLDDVSMPVVGAEAEANDTFIEQIVANAGAAIDAAAATGYVDPRRVGVAGHSYGAFMVANLLAHSRLFGAGIALSGAYNRTLTPFGFQTERRTLWEAPDTYLAMSPLLYSHQIEAPLLLVHGLDDDNAATSPLQSTQFYAAIRGNGGNADILLLPWEGHSYRARESVLDTAAHMLDWFDRHLKEREPIVAQKETGASPRPSL